VAHANPLATKNHKNLCENMQNSWSPSARIFQRQEDGESLARASVGQR